MASKSVKPDGPQGRKAMPSQALKGEGVETRRRPPTGCKAHGEGIVQGVQKWAQTGILWSQVQVLHGLPLDTCEAAWAVRLAGVWGQSPANAEGLG